MHMGNTNYGTNYHLGNEQIPHDTKEKDLGVYITENCKTTKQLQAKVMSNTHFDQKCFTTLYKTYIRPYLEYCVQAWSPSLKKDVMALEKVQQRTTKIIPSLRNKLYEDRLKAFNL